MVRRWYDIRRCVDVLCERVGEEVLVIRHKCVQITTTLSMSYDTEEDKEPSFAEVIRFNETEYRLSDLDLMVTSLYDVADWEMQELIKRK